MQLFAVSIKESRLISITQAPGVDWEKIINDGDTAQAEPLDEKAEYGMEAAGLDLPEQQHVRRIVGLALGLGKTTNRVMTHAEKKRRKKMAQLNSPEVRAIAGALPELMLRMENPEDQLRAMEMVRDAIGIPGELPLITRLGMFAITQRLLWPMTKKAKMRLLPKVKKEIQKDVSGFVKIVEDDSPEAVIGELNDEADAEQNGGVGYEANLVVEAAITQAEANKNKEWYKKAIRAGARRIAIKPTALVPLSGSAIATASSSAKLQETLEEIFTEAESHKLGDGSEHSYCLVSIDSEQAALLDMTWSAILAATKNHPNVRLQVAAQAYLPDTQAKVEQLLKLSSEQVAANGAAKGIRLVCGANQEGEELVASLGGWEETPLAETRPEAHANYRYLRDLITQDVVDGNFTVTIASMNKLTIMDALDHFAQAGLFHGENSQNLSLSMLRGMTGDETFRALKQMYGEGIDCFNYTPIIPQNRIVELFKYYLRRLQELVGKPDDQSSKNCTGVECAKGIGSKEWKETQILDLIRSIRAKVGEALQPQIKPNRGEYEEVIAPTSLADFRKIPDPNWGADEVRKWGIRLITECDSYGSVEINLSDAVKGDDESARERPNLTGPTIKDKKLADVEYANTDDIDRAYDLAESDEANWESTTLKEKLEKMRTVVNNLRQGRDEIIKALMMDAGKSIPEADGELNEGMDFINLAILHAEELDRQGLGLGTEGNGVATVICPKNFPVAIPIAQIVARLIAGYRVIVKPSGGADEETIRATYEMVKCFHQAGISEDTLIFLPCEDKPGAEHLTGHDKCERIDFTGGYNTARTINKNNDDAELIAETGAVNSIIVDRTADPKEAALLIVKSAFGFAGQKCSCPRAVFIDDQIIDQVQHYLIEITLELLNKNALTLHTDITPLIKNPDAEFEQQLTNCADGEEWVLEPADAHKPGIRRATAASPIKPEDLKEIFGPQFTLIPFSSADGSVAPAVDMANSTLGALTGSLISRDDKNIAYALEDFDCGNLYINNKCTGALAHQGFGDGRGKAHLGAHGTKTGTREWLIAHAKVGYKPDSGPRYEPVKTDRTGLLPVLQHLNTKINQLDETVTFNGQQIKPALSAGVGSGYSYLHGAQNYFSLKRAAPYKTKGQQDWFESKPIGNYTLRLTTQDNLTDILRGIFATIAAGNHLRLSVPPAMRNSLWELSKTLGIHLDQLPNVELVVEDDTALMEAYKSDEIACVGYTNRAHVPAEVFTAAAGEGKHIDCRERMGHYLNDMQTQHYLRSKCNVVHVAGDTSYEDAKQKPMVKKRRDDIDLSSLEALELSYAHTLV